MQKSRYLQKKELMKEYTNASLNNKSKSRRSNNSFNMSINNISGEDIDRKQKQEEREVYEKVNRPEVKMEYKGYTKQSIYDRNCKWLFIREHKIN